MCWQRKQCDTGLAIEGLADEQRSWPEGEWVGGLEGLRLVSPDPRAKLRSSGFLPGAMGVQKV